MFDVPLFPPKQPLSIWLIVLGCVAFWLVAYVLIIRRTFTEKTTCMPVPALCANIAWEFIFSVLYREDYLLPRIGSWLWLTFDIVILVGTLRFGSAECTHPWTRRFFAPLVFFGIGLGVWVMIPFVKAYQDVHGFVLGWLDALMMGLLFITLLLRRNSVKGQSFYIAFAMMMGNVFAWLWNRYFPEVHPFSQAQVLRYFLATFVVDFAYVVMVYRQCRKDGINPWKRF
jgi:hypothetical protein